MATPSVNMLTTCDPFVMNQILSQPKKVHQDPAIMSLLAMWGENIITVDDEKRKHHRRVVNAGFTPDTHAKVWEEASEQAQTLVDLWQSQGSVVAVMRYWTTKLALHVVSSTFFHKKVTWESTDSVPEGHRMGFQQALKTVIKNIHLIAMYKDSLKWVPFRKTKEAHTAFVEWTAYMKELRQVILDRLDGTIKKPNKSLLGAQNSTGRRIRLVLTLNRESCCRGRNGRREKYTSRRPRARKYLPYAIGRPRDDREHDGVRDPPARSPS